MTSLRTPKRLSIGLLGLVVLLLLAPSTALATPQVSFTFDDGYQGIYDYAAPILSQTNIPGVAYITTNYIGQNGYMSWEQVQALQNTYHWEIGSHTVSHPLLTKLNSSKLDFELSRSKEILQSYGLKVEAFATPYGDSARNIHTRNDKVISFVAKYYSSLRPFHDLGLNRVPFNDYLLLVRYVNSRTSVEEVKQWIDEANINDTWLILVFHNIVDQLPDPFPYTDSDDEYYFYPDERLQAIVEYVKYLNLSTPSVSEALQTVNNKVQNPSFEEVAGGWVSAWRRDNTSLVTLNSENKGSYPYPRNSIRLVGGKTASHLFSDYITVNPEAEYFWQTYVNLPAFPRGGVGFYVDEYDLNGSWISGQWLGEMRSKFVGVKGMRYKPTSSAVAKVGLQYYVKTNSKLTVYLDSVRFWENP